MVGGPDYVFDSKDGGLTTPEFREVRDSKLHAAIHNILYSICGYLPSIIILGGASIVPLAVVMAAEEMVAPMPDSLYVFTVLIPLCIFFSSIGYTIYSLGMWMRRYSKGCWERAIPPHGDVNDDSVYTIISHILFGYEATYYRSDEEGGDVFLSFTISIFILFLFALAFSIAILVLGGELGLVDGFERTVASDGEIGVGGTVSVFAASLSILLGAVFGLITLGIFTIAINPFDVLVLLFLIALPSIISAPLFKNSVWYSKHWHYEQSGLAIGRSRTQLSFLASLYFLACIFLLILFSYL